MNRPHFLIIPAAGKGTRMKPVNPHLPKELLPIGSKAAIEYALEEGLDAGIEHFIIILSRDKETIRSHLSTSALSITYLYQQRPLGESDAISVAESVVGNHPLAIIYPDNLYLPAPGALKLLTETFHRHSLDVIGLSAVTRENAPKISNSGRVDLSQETENLYRIKRFVPKGQGHFKPRFTRELRACGMMVTGAHIFDAIGRTRPTVSSGEFTDEPVRSLLLKEKGLLGYRLPGTVFDIGNQQAMQCASDTSTSLNEATLIISDAAKRQQFSVTCMVNPLKVRNMVRLSQVIVGKDTTVHCVPPEALVSEAVAKMHKHNIGALLIVKTERLVGIFTERDVLFRVVGGNLDPKSTPVSEVMTPDPVCVTPLTTLQEAMALITVKRIRHLPVLESDRILAMVSSGDLNHSLVKNQERRIDTLMHQVGILLKLR